MTEVSLPGLDGSNPLAFMAALGVLRVLDDKARRDALPAPSLSWREQPVWTPVVVGPSSIDEILAGLEDDRVRWTDEPSMRLAYTKDGTRVAPETTGAVRDLKPVPRVMREFLEETAARAADGDARSARHAAAYGTDVAQDKKGNTKPTALHFAAGQQTFLGAVAGIQKSLDRDDLVSALVGPWKHSTTLKSLGWDPEGAFNARIYALRAGKPVDRPCAPGVEWLAFVGLSFFPTVPRGRNVLTTCVLGRGKGAKFVWPLWTAMARARTVESIVRTGHIEQMPPTDRRARGIVRAFSCRILRNDHGYGSFSPSRAC